MPTYGTVGVWSLGGSAGQGRTELRKAQAAGRVSEGAVRGLGLQPSCLWVPPCCPRLPGSWRASGVRLSGVRLSGMCAGPDRGAAAVALGRAREQTRPCSPAGDEGGRAKAPRQLAEALDARRLVC